MYSSERDLVLARTLGSCERAARGCMAAEGLGDPRAREGVGRRVAASRRSAGARVSPIATVGAIALVAVSVGWSLRDDSFLVPYEGLGYALGVAGLAMMLTLLLYSVRKRWSPLVAAGPIGAWFQVHMALGILGPTAILFHANFRLGSLNANVALACMLAVSLSGIIGRFIYTKIHHEYLGRVASVAALRSASGERGQALAGVISIEPEVGHILSEFRERALGSSSARGGQVRTLLSVGHRARVARRRALTLYRDAAAQRPEGLPRRADVRRALTLHVRTIRSAAEFESYERLFALWHALHMPFCVVLFAAAAVHVFAVHMY
jgi:hypothetical protein